MQVPVDPLTRTVQLRGIHFPVDLIRAEMMETGGIPVSDPDINKALDKIVLECLAGGKKAEMLFIEAIPGYAFLPRRILMHDKLSPEGRKTELHLYFAIRRQYHA